MSGSGKKFLLVGLLALLVFVGIAAYGDFREVWRQLWNFPPGHLAAAFSLALLNYLLRFFRWAFYLRILGVAAPIPLSGLIFLAGLAMTITPGKVGELLKSYLLKEKAAVPVAASAPVVLMERVTDLISVALVGLLGILLLPPLVSSLLVGALAVAGIAMYLLTTRHTDALLRWPLFRRWGGELAESREIMRQLTQPGPMAVAITLGLIAWVSEGVALWVVLHGLNADVSLLLSLPIYAGSSMLGALTTLPGGLGLTELSMVALIGQAGAPEEVAAVGTLLVRVVTLWFAVALGLLALGWLNRRPPSSAPAPPLPEPDASLAAGIPEEN